MRRGVWRKGEEISTMHRIRWSIVAVIVTVTTLLSVLPVAAGQPPQRAAQEITISPYWGSAVQQWEPLIIDQAQYRGLDPDMVAAVVWHESHGRSYARGPAGAVGLMMLMPKEAGFSWRPTTQRLLDPETNVAWGTRALATVAFQSRGDMHNALAAYNGGWEQIDLHGPRIYAEAVLMHYARAVAMRHGLSPEGHWVATVAATDEHAQTVLTVLGPQRPLARYGARPVAAHIPDVSASGVPTAVIFAPTGGRNTEAGIGIWISVDGQIVHSADTQLPTSQEAPMALSGLREAWMRPQGLSQRQG